MERQESVERQRWRVDIEPRRLHAGDHLPGAHGPQRFWVMVISRCVFIHLGLSHDGVFTPRAAAYHVSCVDTEITTWARIKGQGSYAGSAGISKCGQSRSSAFLYLRGFTGTSVRGQRSVYAVSHQNIRTLTKNHGL